MGRMDSLAFMYIQGMCSAHQLDSTKLLLQSKVLLNCYRRVYWDATNQCALFPVNTQDAHCHQNKDFLEAVDYLMQFDPKTGKQATEKAIQLLFETRCMVEMVDTAMLRVKDFPDKGDVYFEILSKRYLGRFRYTEKEILDILKLERSRYYDNKREAMLVFGISIWGGELPKFKRLLMENDPTVLPIMS